MMVAIIAALSVVMIASPVMAQNMTGGNMTGGNVTGGNMTGKVSNAAEAGCPVSAEGTPAEFCAQDEGQSEDDEEEQEGGN
jgi:hypothetical protein